MTPAEFRAARQALGLTQPKMAQALGLKLRAVQYYESGGRKIPETVAKLIATMGKAPE